MIKTIQMSGGLKEDEMDLQIRAEADQYLPFSQEDNEGVALDWEIEGESDNSSDMVDVILVACRSDRKSTRLNSSHVRISYAVFCLKKKKKHYNIIVLCSA